ncbi:MAG: hypothetical protein QNK29_12350 [Desulfobacterales bacterium]|nr:hypothetical protein [Desulfobacterales bacterium]MDX2495709.1 hypothetical protein [Desulfuromusa sp.]
MNSIEIYIVVEGTTERTFVQDVLAPELAIKNKMMIRKKHHQNALKN